MNSDQFEPFSKVLPMTLSESSYENNAINMSSYFKYS